MWNDHEKGSRKIVQKFSWRQLSTKTARKFCFWGKMLIGTRNWSETKLNFRFIDICLILCLLKMFFVTRYTMNVHGDVVVSLFLLDTTHQEQSVSNAPFVLFSFPQTSLSSILIDFLRKMTNTFNQMPLILTLGEDTLNYLVIHQK